MRRVFMAFAVLLLAWAIPLTAQAHKPSDSYLTLTVSEAGRIGVNWHVALRDLDNELALDANDDGRLTWGEVRARWADMRRFVQTHLRLVHGGEACLPLPDEAKGTPPALIEHTDGRYAVFAWSQQCALAPGHAWAGVTLDYSLFALTDPTHRGIVRWRWQASGGVPQEMGVVVMGANRASHAQTWLALAQADVAAPGGKPVPASVDAHPDAPPDAQPGAKVASAPAIGAAAGPQAASSSGLSAWDQVQRTVRDGVEHISAGTDHILFLVLLLLVAVWQRQATPDTRSHGRGPMADWSPRGHWRSALGEVLRLVTAFTVAHSITLGLATFGVISPPSRWVESLIALSVLVAAVDNLWPVLRAPRWAVVFGFGLVHGFGFAGAMQDLGLSARDLAWPLLGFNLGVELGQLALVALVLPLCFALRRTAFYRLGVVLPGSLAIGLMALVWLVERCTDRVILGWGG